jgi:hypothetical protein
MIQPRASGPDRVILSRGSNLAKFRVIDLRSQTIEAEHLVDAHSPEAAAERALGEKTVRGQRGQNTLLCRVYWQDSNGPTNMVRLYRPATVDG